ncbi:MAG: SGNH/GDSL hydrolase family protein [Planctomycetaceae bacterium]
MSRALFSCLVAAAMFSLIAKVGLADESGVTLKKGDRIVFLGDSITQGGNSHDKGYVRLIRKTLTEKHADLELEVIGAGISGNKVPDLQRRLEKDVLSRKPTLVVIYIGINDVWHGENDPARGTLPEAFAAGLKEVIGRCTEAGAKVVVCTPTVIGEKKDGGNKLDQRLDQYSDISRNLAKELKLPLCDLRKAFLDYLKENNAENADKGILTTDRVHLNDAGNKFVADTMLKVIDQGK